MVFRRGHGPGTFQHDPHELLVALFDATSTASMAAFRFSPSAFRTTTESTTMANRVFGFDFVYSTVCIQCSSTTTTVQPMKHLCVPITQLSTQQRLTSLIDNVFTQETMSGDDRFACTRCQQRCDALRSTTLANVSDVLILQLLRFNSSSEKIQTLVASAPIIDLSRHSASNEIFALVCEQNAVCTTVSNDEIRRVVSLFMKEIAVMVGIIIRTFVGTVFGLSPTIQM